MSITELNINPSQRESDWILNVSESDASTGIVLRQALPDYRYGIKSVTISTVEDEKWILLLDGDTPIIGPLRLGKYIPITLTFESPIYCTIGNSLVLQTEQEFDVYLLIKGTTGPPIPSQPYDPVPEDGITGVATDITLSWSSLYQSISYEVFLGTTSISPLVSEQNETTYTASLQPNTTYFWRVDEHWNGNMATGNIWTFTTGSING